MAKFCGKCGSPIDEKTGLCPNCDKTVTANPQKEKAKPAHKAEKKLSKKEIKAEKKRAKHAALTTGQKVKRFFLKLLAAILALGVLAVGIIAALSYFNVVNVPVISPAVAYIVDKLSDRSEAKKIETAFSEHDVEEINRLIFGKKKSALEQQVEDEFGITFDDQSGNDTFNKDGFIAKILERTTVTVGRIGKDSVKYKVSAPDMKDSLTGITDVESREELEKKLIEHITAAQMKETEVEVTFEEVDGNLVFNYQTEQFLDAITGGFITEYGELYALLQKEVTGR